MFLRYLRDCNISSRPFLTRVLVQRQQIMILGCKGKVFPFQAVTAHGKSACSWIIQV